MPFRVRHKRRPNGSREAVESVMIDQLTTDCFGNQTDDSRASIDRAKSPANHQAVQHHEFPTCVLSTGR